MTDSLRPELLAFLQENIGSVPHLEALLLLWKSTPSEWSATDVATRIYVPYELSVSILDDLTRRDLAICTRTDPPCYTFNSGGDHASMVPVVAAAYKDQLVAVSTFIHSRAPASVRDFARAFQFKGGPKK